VNESLSAEIKGMAALRDKYDDLKAEWMTLHQTNQEYKRTLQAKVKETMKLSKDFDNMKRRLEGTLKETAEDQENHLTAISSLQVEQDMLKNTVNDYETLLAAKEREISRAQDSLAEASEKHARDVR